MSSLIWTALAKTRMQNLETQHYYVLCTLFPLLGYLDNQNGKFLKLWMTNLGFREFPDLIEYYTTIGTGTILKGEYTTIENFTLLKDINNLMYLTQPNFLEDIPNQILHMVSRLILLSKTFCITIGQYPTL